MAKNETEMVRVHKNLKNWFEQGRQVGVPMTSVSKELANFLRETDVQVLNLFRRKKGSVLDLIGLVAILFCFALAIIVGYYILTVFSTNPLLTSYSMANYTLQRSLASFLVYDNLFLAALIGISLSSVVAAALVRTTPIYFFMSIVLLAIILMVGAIVSNTFYAFTNANPHFNTSLSAFPKMNFLMNNIVLYLAVMGILIIIALYSFRGASAYGE